MDKKYVQKMEKVYNVEGFEALIQNLSDYLAQNNLSQQEVEDLAENFFKITAGGGDFFETSAGILFQNFHNKFPDSKILNEHFENIKQELQNNGNDYFVEKDGSHDIQEFTRTQTYKTESILEKIETVIKTAVNAYYECNDTAFEKIIINNPSMAIGIQISAYFVKNDEPVKYKVAFNSLNLMLDLMGKINDEMYKQAKHEGCWFFCKIEILPSLEYRINFYYDDKNILPEERLKTSENFLYEFKTLPRSKEFTPEWWRKILGKNAKYIKK